jgi:hypothetical protein
MAMTAIAEMKRCAIFLADVLPGGKAFTLHGLARESAISITTSPDAMPIAKVTLQVLGHAAISTAEQMALAVLAGDTVAAMALADKLINGD